MRSKQITISCPANECQEIFDDLRELKRSGYLNISAFCRIAIQEKLKRMEVRE